VTTDLQAAKRTVRNFYRAFDAPAPSDRAAALKAAASDGYIWRGVHPFNVQADAEGAITAFWHPFAEAFSSWQRREDVFFAGRNDAGSGASVWVVSMGHLLGLFDRDFLAIPATGRLAHLRYAEFHRVENNQLAETALFCDLLSLMDQAGVYPLPPMTGAGFMYPGPRTHDGLLEAPHDPAEGAATLALINTMIDDLSGLNALDGHRCSPELLARSWAPDMLWYGPSGIGASYTIPRYQEQHQYPFRLNLADKTYNGHVARFAEGNYAGFFGWPNLNNRNTGGFLGLTASATGGEMRIVDIYRREGNKLAENWVLIDLPHYLLTQGLDIFARLRQLRRIEPI
jgi:hypothetical protein